MPRLRRPHIAGAQAWARTPTLQTANKARRAKREMIVVVPLLAGRRGAMG
jgi:hypothetical protein